MTSDLTSLSGERVRQLKAKLIRAVEVTPDLVNKFEVEVRRHERRLALEEIVRRVGTELMEADPTRFEIRTTAP